MTVLTLISCGACCGADNRRAFRAITTGHSNRRRTQAADFEELEIVFPADPRVQKGGRVGEELPELEEETEPAGADV